jgi:nucleotide-binding universal stress UspA family protein
MLKILAPLDGSNNARRVVDYLVQIAATLKDVEVVLVNVREPVEGPEVGRFWNPQQIEEFQQREGSLLLQPACDRLQAAGVRHSAQVMVGEIAQTIVDHAAKQGCDMIVMGHRGMGAIAELLMGSVTTKVLHLTQLPVTLVK